MVMIVNRPSGWEPFVEGLSQGADTYFKNRKQNLNDLFAKKIITDAAQGEGYSDYTAKKPQPRTSQLKETINDLLGRFQENILQKPYLQQGLNLGEMTQQPQRTPSAMELLNMQSQMPQQQDLVQQRLPGLLQQASQNPAIQQQIAREEAPEPFKAPPITPEFLRSQADRLENLGNKKYTPKVANLRHQADRLEDKMERTEKRSAPKKMTVAVFQKIWEMANEDPEKAKKLAESLGYEIPKSLSDIEEE
jgi:hypothetical protein